MKSIKIPGCNLEIGKGQPEYNVLHAIDAGGPEGEIIAAFELSEEELAEINKTKMIFYKTWTFGNRFQPMKLLAKLDQDYNFIDEDPEKNLHWAIALRKILLSMLYPSSEEETQERRAFIRDLTAMMETDFGRDQRFLPMMSDFINKKPPVVPVEYDLTKQQAIEEMTKGRWMKHETFVEGERITMFNGKIRDENNFDVDAKEWWSFRKTENFLSGWAYA